MMTDRFHAPMVIVTIGIGVLMVRTGCAAKRVASNSGDQSEAMRNKSNVETVRESPVVSVQTPPSVRESPGQNGGERQQPTPIMSGSGSLPIGSTVTPGTAASANFAGLGDIYFDFDQYTIRKDAQAILDENTKWLRREIGKSFIIEGHCDERGTLAYNLVLGEKRARSAKRYLEDLGIPGSRLQTTSYGEVRPFCKDHNESCWSKNRRAHFSIQ